jgi:hypothetical protein
MKLSEENSNDLSAIKAIASELGNLAYDFYKKTTRMCTILVSSLDDEPFTTHSDRDVVTWSPRPPDSSAIKAIVTPFSEDSLEQCVATTTWSPRPPDSSALKAIVTPFSEDSLEHCVATTTAAAGYHLRSIAVAAINHRSCWLSLAFDCCRCYRAQ